MLIFSESWVSGYQNSCIQNYWWTNSQRWSISLCRCHLCYYQCWYLFLRRISFKPRIRYYCSSLYQWVSLSYLIKKIIFTNYRGLLFKVQLGSNSLSGTDTNRLTVSTSLYYIHPDFDADTLDNDIGLIKFHMPISYTGKQIKQLSICWGFKAEIFLDYIQPVYLPTVHQPDGMNVTAVGWGQISDCIKFSNLRI